MSNTLKLGNGKWATGKDTLLAYNDLNNNFKPLPFSFSRGTNATVVNEQGLIELVGSDEPRIDFKDNTKGSLLLEPTRSNVITNSNNLTTWNGAAMTRTFVDNLTNPSNVLGASKLTQTSSGGYAWLSRTFTGNETFSAFVKKDSSNFVRLYAANNTVYFDIVKGTVEIAVGSSITDKSIIDYGNGWFRVSMSVNSTAASYVRIYPASTVDSSSGTNSLFVYGAQLEQGSYATSYIPTNGSAATRVADGSSQTVPDGVIGQTEGTIFAEFEYFGNTSGALEISPIYIGTGTYATAIYTDIYQGELYAVCFNSGVNQASINCGVLSVGTHKVAIGYSNNDIVIYLDGLLGGIDTSATIPKCNRVYLGTVGTSTSVQKYTQSQAQLYNTRLSNSELQALTTI